MTSKSGEALEKLREFGYAFNAEGQLRKIDETTGETSEKPYEYDVFEGDREKNEEHYQKLANQIPEIVYDLLEQNGLKRTYIPENLPPEESTFFFSYPEALENPKKLIVMIHGSGFVRAGQWARSLIINNSLDHGTQLPYIKRAQSLGYDILVTNTNDNHREKDGRRLSIPGLSSASLHASHIWEKYVIGSNPESVAIVAHSYGGTVAFGLAQKYPKFFKEKVFAIALTDSAHFGLSKEVLDIVSNMTCNWVSSEEPLDTEVCHRKGDVRCISAGHIKHEWTSYSAFESVFKFLEDKYEEFLASKNLSKKPKLEE